jgi:hypothetical protein
MDPSTRSSCTSLQRQLRTNQQSTFHQFLSSRPITFERDSLFMVLIQKIVAGSRQSVCMIETVYACACATRQCHRDLRLPPQDSHTLNSIGNLDSRLRGPQTSWASSKARAILCASASSPNCVIELKAELPAGYAVIPSRPSSPQHWAIAMSHCTACKVSALSHGGFWAARSISAPVEACRSGKELGIRGALLMMDGFYIFPSWRLPRAAD